MIAAVFAQVGALLLAATSKKPTSSSAGFLIIILVIGVGAYFFFLRPQQQKARRQRQHSQDIAVGDEILTVGGIVGRVVALDAERVTILSGVVAGSDGGSGAGVDPSENEPTRLVLVRNAIARKVEPPVGDVVDVATDSSGQWDRNGDAAGAAAEGVAGRVETHEPPEEGTGP